MVSNEVISYFKHIVIMFLCLAFPLSLNAAEVQKPAGKNDLENWNELKEDLFADKKIIKDAKWLTLDAPYRAHDAAIVPITVKASLQKPGQYFKTVSLIIDNNPAPVAATIQLSPKMGPLHLETRVRIDQYSHIRAVVETSDGQLYMVAKYVKAAGGCSAPAMKDMEAKMALLGKSKLRQFSRKPDKKPQLSKVAKIPGQREVQLMVRHPNYSGMQLNQETGYYIPAHYVSEISVKVNNEELIKIEGAISLSEDPAFRFRFISDEDLPTLKMTVKDTENNVFKNQWQLKPLSPSKGS